MRALRVLLVVDAAVLFLLGLLLIFAPRQVAAAFQFQNLPAGVDYIIGLWGCVLTTLALGYVAAAEDPVRHVIWVQVGIARGTLECLLGLVSAVRGIVTFSQASPGIILSGLIAIAYVLLYPRQQLLPAGEEPAAS
jgi:hypothetical protein